MKAINQRSFLSIFLFTILISVVTASTITLVKQDSSSAAVVFVSPFNVNVRVNQTFEVEVNVFGVSDLYGWEFKLGYNTSLLELVTINEGSFLNSSRDTYFVPKVMSTDGCVLAGCTSLRNVSGVSGNGTLASVEFRAKKLGSCTLDLYDTKLVNSAKQLVEHSEVDGSVTVSGCVVIRVQYLDGYPRSGADVRKSWPLPYIPLGTTNESGMVESCGILSGPQDYQVQAWYSGSQFGPNTGLYVDGNGDGSTIISANYEITPPAINVLSPQNQTYSGRNIPLTYYVYDYSPTSWTGYSLNGQSNMTLNGNTTLNLSKGSYSIVVYSNDTYGNMGSSGTIYFTVQGGCVTIRVQYLDGSPRPGAVVARIDPPPTLPLGTSNESGYVTKYGALAPGAHLLQATYGGSQFGPNTGLWVNENGDGSTIIQANYEITPPVIEILSPQNLTYTNSSVPLTFAVYDYSPVSWIGYSLDNQLNTTITGNTTLTVEDGTHRIVVYANDSFGNMGCSQIVHFTIGEHDIAVANITVSKTIVGQAYSTSIKVIVENQGDRTETFNVTVYANTTSISTQTITLTSGNSITITFTWNTTGFAKGNYTISAYAWPVQGETDTADNTKIDGTVFVTVAGDVTGEGLCDIQDISILVDKFLAEPSDPQWDPNCDVNDDHIIDIADISIAVDHFLQDP